MWAAGPDLVASGLLTGKVPEIVEAFRLVPVGRQSGLRPVALQNQVEIDPARENFFKRLVEERQLARHRPDLTVEVYGAEGMFPSTTRAPGEPREWRRQHTDPAHRRCRTRRG